MWRVDAARRENVNCPALLRELVLIYSFVEKPGIWQARKEPIDSNPLACFLSPPPKSIENLRQRVTVDGVLVAPGGLGFQKTFDIQGIDIDSIHIQ